ncbi:MAG: hypothetical protein ACREEY_10395 [Brevundimonas sp.]
MAEVRTAVGFLLSDDHEAAAAFVARCEREGLRPRLVRAAYEIETPEVRRDWPVDQPTDYLNPAQMDAVHADVLTWLRQFPLTQLKRQVLADWRAGPRDRLPAAAWANSLAPYVQICLRVVRLTAAVAEVQAPVAWALLGHGPDAGWQAPLMRDVMRRDAPTAKDWNPPSPPAPIPVRDRVLAAVRRLARHIPLMFQKTESYPAALAHLGARVERKEAAEGFDGHVVMISRGQRGTHWLESRSKGRPILIDEYSEGMPDALAELCVKRNWRLTIVWESPRPTVNGLGYSDRWPDHVAEIVLADLKGVAPQFRSAVRARLDHALGRLFGDRAFREAMQVDGIDMLTPYEDHLRPMFANLGVLMTTQAELWGGLFKRLRPDVVVGGRLESRPWINLAAAQAGARTASIKLGIGDEMMLSLMAFWPEGRHEGSGGPDALLVWGDHQVGHITRQLPGMAAEVHAVGRTRSDTFFNEPGPDEAETARIRQVLGLKPEGRVIVWGGTCRSRWGLWPGQTSASAVMSPESWRGALEALCRVAQGIGAQVLVKPHPADDLGFVARETARMDAEVCVLAPMDAGVHNNDLLAVSDIFVSSVSSMFAEALMAGKVAVNLWTPEIGMIYENARFDLYSNIAAPAPSIDEAAEVADRLLRDPLAYEAERARALAALPRFFGPIDGGNAARAAAWCLDQGAEASRRRTQG